MSILKKHPGALIIIDGFGWWRDSAENAIAQARTPFLDQYLEKYPHTWLEAARDSRTGHRMLGAGRTSDESREAKNSSTLLHLLRAANVRTLRLTESASQQAITSFIEGSTEPGESAFPDDCLIVPSADIESFARRPEMSAFRVTDKICRALDDDEADFYLINFSNAAIVAETGNYAATVEAIESVDTCLGWVIGTIERVRGAAIITATHGLAERLTTASPVFSETQAGANLVPFLLCDRSFSDKLRETGTLADIAPTVLDLFGLEKSQVMTGQSLLIHDVR